MSEIDHNQFFAKLKNKEYDQCYLFSGEEEWIKHHALEVLTDTVVGNDFREMNVTVMLDPAPDAIIAAGETLPLMNEKRLIIIKQSALIDNAVKNKDYDLEKATASIINYLPHASPSSHFVFLADGKADKRRKLYVFLQKNATIVSFNSLDSIELSKWILKQCKAYNVAISRENCERLIFMCGKNLYNLNAEIEKLCAYASDKPEINREDIVLCCHTNEEYSVFMMTNALFGGDAATAFSMLDNQLKNGEQRLAILNLIGGQCRRLQYIAMLKRNRMNDRDVAKELGLPEFAVRESWKQASKYKVDVLKRLSDLCLEIEFQVKSGNINETGSLEYIMLEILNANRGEPIHAIG